MSVDLEVVTTFCAVCGCNGDLEGVKSLVCNFVPDENVTVRLESFKNLEKFLTDVLTVTLASTQQGIPYSSKHFDVVRYLFHTFPFVVNNLRDVLLPLAIQWTNIQTLEFLLEFFTAHKHPDEDVVINEAWLEDHNETNNSWLRNHPYVSIIPF